MFTGFCRRSVYNWMYSGPILSYGFYISWIINNLLLVSWLVLWDREQLTAALIFLCWITFTGYIVLFFSYRGVHARVEELQEYHKSDLWLLRILVHNGVATYITWTTIATLINFAVVLTYVGGVSRSTAATVCLSVLLIEVIAWFVVENFFLDKYVRYTLTIYPVVILALSGNIAKNFKPDSPGTNGIFCAVLLGIASTLFLLRILLVLWKHLKSAPGVKPENTTNY
ncbi:uncharacterized protein LOC114653448 [Erpetoichthys calabaricus]|uniref:uncharacterized protein LOC114653448 n=1 Tax=Erpetoichthys calabaricus TaxID=27687 RepID=UPI0022348959|nr:uncharacterized protein LOC114653448 [Erpetoichthys calabaricus]